MKKMILLVNAVISSLFEILPGVMQADLCLAWSKSLKTFNLTLLKYKSNLMIYAYVITTVL